MSSDLTVTHVLDCSPAAELANPSVKCEIDVGETLDSHRHSRGLRPDADWLIRHDEIGPGRYVDQKVPQAVTRKADHVVAVLLERKPSLEWRVARFTLTADGLDRAQTGGPYQSGSVDTADTRLHWDRSAT
jgi:hypothetical protein